MRTGCCLSQTMASKSTIRWPSVPAGNCRGSNTHPRCEPTARQRHTTAFVETASKLNPIEGYAETITVVSEALPLWTRCITAFLLTDISITIVQQAIYRNSYPVRPPQPQHQDPPSTTTLAALAASIDGSQTAGGRPVRRGLAWTPRGSIG